MTTAASLAKYLDELEPQPWFGKTVRGLAVTTSPHGSGHLATLALTCEGKRHGFSFEMETLRDISVVMQTTADWVARNAVVTE